MLALSPFLSEFISSGDRAEFETEFFPSSSAKAGLTRASTPSLAPSSSSSTLLRFTRLASRGDISRFLFEAIIFK
jgi:hypothetical protein